jgi:hypothetical protein
MSYYGARGDFYGGGGYYRGDPGFLGGLFKKALPIAASFIPGVGGMIASAATSLLGSNGGGGTLPAQGQAFRTPVVTQQPTISAAGSAAMPARVRGRGTLAGRLSGIARKALPTMAGAVSGSLATRGAAPAAAAGFRMRRRHRMNVCNPRALRRAIRRAHGFERIAKQVIGFSSPHKRHGRVYFKRKRRARR